MEINEDLVKKIARLARLNLSEKEIKKFIPEMKEILSAFSTLNELDTEGIAPSFHPVPIKNVMRQDKIEPSLSQEIALSNSSNTKDGYFKGPKAV